MKSFIFGLCLTLLASVANATLKTDYGHYYAHDDETLCNTKKGIIGVSSRINWAGAEPTQGVYSYTNYDTMLTNISGMGSPVGVGGQRIPNNQCKLWIFPQWKVFFPGNPCPSWLVDQNGNPGIAPTNASTSIVKIAAGAGSVTNASPIVITLAAAATFSNGATVFVDNVAGNTAANGFWTVANMNPGKTSFQLQGSTGNAARQQSGTPTGWYGRVTFGGAFICKLWDPVVLAAFKTFIIAYAAHYDSNANIEGFVMEESSISSSGVYDDGPSSGGDYTGSAWTNAIIGIMQQCSTSFATSHCMAFMNFIQGNQSGVYAVSAALSALANHNGCYSGPDILPNSASLVGTPATTGINGTYQALIRHTGCRADSAQNTTIVGTPPPQGKACGATDCNAVFQFAVGGVFGTLPESVPVVSPYGLCINSYIFWNSTTAEQALADPTIQANPYGLQWYGQCSCGGGIP